MTVLDHGSRTPSVMTLRFSADRAGRAPLTWGQIAIWNVFEQLPATDYSLNILAHWELPSGLSVPEVLTALRRTVERHDSLRTRFPRTAQGPCQEVCADGDLPVEVHEVTPDELTWTAETVGEGLRQVPFDHAADLPVRIAILTCGGEPRTLVVGANHMALDGWSLGIVKGDFELLLAGDALGPLGLQPLDRVAFEESEPALGREAKALQWWCRSVNNLPNRLLASVREVGERQSFTWAQQESAAIVLAARSVSLRTGVAAGQVVLAAAALLLAAYTDARHVALRTIVATRFQTGTRDLVGAFNQNALFYLEIVPESFDEFVRRAAGAALRGYRNSEYHPDKLESVVAEILAERGIPRAGYCFFNDVRFALGDKITGVDPAGAAAAAAGIADALPKTVITSVSRDNDPFVANFFLYLFELSDQALLQLGIEDGFFGPREPADYLRDLESLLTRAALGELSVPQLLAHYR
ncbi:condensation domain-containing protein [Micromonospora sp. NPDC050397]|uniref:condensation domain-containing protein n=1 Tax=Micromonospora sp. NPDC050397 TaxID=3364279 RepID=UPI00384D0B41